MTRFPAPGPTARPGLAPLRARRQMLRAALALPGWALFARGAAAARGERGGPDAPALQLALDAPEDIDPSGFLVSEKYDGARAYWDGARLRFRSGLPVAAPRGFVERLPNQPLDGELWLGRGRFEALSSLVRREVPDPAGWAALRFMVFDLPAAPGPFEARVAALQALAASGSFAFGVAPQQRPASREALQRQFEAVVAAGGEGLVLHRADALWSPGRSGALLKLRPWPDADAEVIAHQPGRGRHEGRLGALVVRDADGLEFKIGSGLTDAERESPPPPGSWITYRYRGRTASGVPRFASFVRVREF